MAQHDSASAPAIVLLTAVDGARDHVRGTLTDGVIVVVSYEDFLCPYCRRLRAVFARLREALGERLVYVFRHAPNERAHPGAELVARAAEAAANQGKFWEMHDRIFASERSLAERELTALARACGLDLERFARDLHSETTAARVQSDLEDGRRNGVSVTPTLFVDSIRYDGAWDFYSMLEALDRPVAARLQRSARVFASLPASGGLTLLLAAALALLCANTPLAPLYQRLVDMRFGIGPLQSALSMPLRDWFSEGLLALFFLLVGLEIRREMTAGALSDRRAALLPILASIGGVLAPAAIYLAFNPGPTAHGWSIPTATDIAFTLAILALLGDRVSSGLRAFLAALAVADDVLSVLTLAIFYPRSFEPRFLIGGAVAAFALFLLNRARVYVIWPYLAISLGLWLSLHAAGVHGALAGVLLAVFLPTRPSPGAAPLLAQAATALAALEQAESEAKDDQSRSWRLEDEPVWDWASRNLSAASQRLLSPADRVERAVAPWSAFVILPLFAFSATGVALHIDLSAPSSGRIFVGVVLGLVLGKPLGVLLSSALAIKSGLAVAPNRVPLRHFIGVACLCGVSDTMALLMVDRALTSPAQASSAKIAVLVGSVLAAGIGALVLISTRASSAEAATAPAE